jgi:hypothetical protein
MPTFEISFMRVDRNDEPTVVEAFSRTVDWLVLPREGEALDIGEGIDPVTVESVGYSIHGYPNVCEGTCSEGSHRQVARHRDQLCGDTHIQDEHVRRLPHSPNSRSFAL